MTASEAAWGSWAFPFWPTFLIVLTGFFYLRGWRKIRRTRPQLFPAWRACCFVGGLFCLWIAIASPLDTLDNLLLVAHMTQHLILMSVVPPLLLLGAPAVPLLRALPRSTVREGLAPFFKTGALHRLGRWLTHPAVAWLAMNLAYLAWHVPAAYDFALRYEGWHQVEHACFLGTSLLFWFPVIQPWPSKPWGSRWLMLPYLIGADLVNTALAAFLTFAGRVVYPSYTAQPRIFGISALDDQVAAGALMWVAGSIFFLIPLVAIAMHLLSPQSQRVTPLARGSRAPQRARVLPVEQSTPLDLLRLPLLGSLLRARYGRMALQSITFLLAVLLIAEGFRGPQTGAMNLAGVLPWNYARALGVVALLVLGNIFCLSCPFMLPREIGARLGLARFHWPRQLRSKWMAIALMILFFWSYEAFDLWDHPLRTAWLLIAYFLVAFVVDAVFRGANFCKYVCPLGQFNFTVSLLSPFILEPRSREVCERCTTHDCIAGNSAQRGCQLQLYMPQKVGNMDCTLCMDCVKACPHDNIGLFGGSTTRDLLRDPQRSSIGRFSSRVDLAVLALVIVVAAFANAAVMVLPRATVAAGGAVTLAVAMVAACVAAGKGLASRAGRSAREIFCRLAQALLPLGVAMWAAHLFFHLLVGWDGLLPALQQAAQDLGLHLAGSPHWASGLPRMPADSILSIQLLVLDAGLLLTLYLGWRLARLWVRKRTAALFLLPWVTAVGVAYALGIWILLAPMQMRGTMHS